MHAPKHATKPRKGFAPEVCRFCGHGGLESCPVCKGAGAVLVRQPSALCPRCAGSGRARSRSYSYLYPRCALCRGAGWLLALMD